MNQLKLQATAQRLFTKANAQIIITRKVSQTLDPSTGDMTNPTTPTPKTFYGVQMGLTDSYIDGRTREWSDQYHISTEIDQAKAKVFVSPGCVAPDGSIDYTFEPHIGDVVNHFDGNVYSIIDAQPLRPAGVIMGHELTLT